jgi:hypothetical protein
MKRWLVPVAAAAAVLMLLGGLWWFAGPNPRGDESSFAGGDTGSSPGSGREPGGSEPGGGEPGFPGTGDPLTEPLTDPPADDPATAPVDPMAVVIDSYYLHDDGRRMSVSYTIGVPECYGRIAEPRVQETDSAVTITLTRIPPENLGDVACIEIALLKTVDIRLDAPLGDRVVLDGSFADAVVERRPVPGTAPIEN